MASQGFVTSVLKGETGVSTAPAADASSGRPTLPAAAIALGAAVVAALLALLVDAGEGFVPRVKTIDALAGLAIGALIVDRLLTFVPPFGAKGAPGGDAVTKAAQAAATKQRSVDIAFLRVGYGALLGSLFVIFTDLRAVKTLTAVDSEVTVSAGVDRLIAVFAIAGGVAGLARLLNGINPQPPTEPKPTGSDGEAPVAASATTSSAKKDDEKKKDDQEVLPPPTPHAYAVGGVAVFVAAVIALFALKDETGLTLIGSETQADGTIALVVRFGTVILMAGIIEQIVERFVAPLVLAKQNKALVTGAVALILGVVAARVIDLFLLHDIGFFGSSAKSLDDALSASTELERWFDVFLTGAIIAAGTKPLHDLSSRLKKPAVTKPVDTAVATRT